MKKELTMPMVLTLVGTMICRRPEREKEYAPITTTDLQHRGNTINYEILRELAGKKSYVGRTIEVKFEQPKNEYAWIKVNDVDKITFLRAMAEENAPWDLKIQFGWLQVTKTSCLSINSTSKKVTLLGIAIASKPELANALDEIRTTDLNVR